MSSPSAGLHAAASSFVPRVNKSIKITRADGTLVDLSSAAKERPATASPAPSNVSPATPTPPTKPALPSMPVVIRMETEAQKAKREADQEAEKQRKLREDHEEKERKEREAARKAAQEKAEQEKIDQAEKAKQEEKEKALKVEQEQKVCSAFVAKLVLVSDVRYDLI